MVDFLSLDERLVGSLETPHLGKTVCSLLRLTRVESIDENILFCPVCGGGGLFEYASSGNGCQPTYLLKYALLT